MTTLTITEAFSIVDGPSREELFDAMRLFNEFRLVTFVLQSRETSGRLNINGPRVAVQAQIQEIGAEDGSGHSWLLQVHFRSNELVKVTNSNDRIDVYYSDKAPRHGAIIDARPLSHRLDVHRDGTIWQYGRKIGHMDNLVRA